MSLLGDGVTATFRGHPVDLPGDDLAVGTVTLVFKNDFQVFGENNKAGFYLLLQPLSPREAGRGIETLRTLTS